MAKLLTALLVIVCCAAAPRTATGPGPTSQLATRPAKVTAEVWVRGQVAAVLDDLEADRDYDRAAARLRAVFDAVVFRATDAQLPAALREAGLARRLVAQLTACEDLPRDELLGLLRANPALAEAIVFAVSDEDDPAEVYAVLESLARRLGNHVGRLDGYANLAAALCVVHDRPLGRQVNGNEADGADPAALFEYFVRNERKLAFGVKEVPPALLVYVVDAAPPIEELDWALRRYKGDAQVAERFFDLEYDYEHFTRRTPKKVTQAGYTLPNLLKFGGVCADQAYYAASVGKAIGVPTAVAVGRGAEVGHAWIGFFERTARGARWNFDTGRYDAYKGVRGLVTDPQTGEPVPDAYVSLLAELVGTTADTRSSAVALTDAALRLAELEPTIEQRGGDADEAVALAGAMAAAGVPERPAPRGVDTPDQLDLLAAAIERCPGDVRPWLVLCRMAERGRLSLDDKRAWSERLTHRYGDKYPDLTLAILDPMIRTIDNPAEQARLWNAAFGLFVRRRADLAAEARMRLAELWAERGERAKAAACYEDVVTRFAAAGPFAVDALVALEGLMVDAGRADAAVALFERTWKKMPRPKSQAGPFARQSNWYVVGELYADRLDRLGQAARAKAVRDDLGRGVRYEGE